VSWKRRLLLAALVSVAASALLAIGILLFGEFDDTQVRILATTFSISVYTLLLLPGTLLWERRRSRPLALANIAAAIAAFTLIQGVIWVSDDDESLWRVAGTASVAALALAQVAGTSVRRRDDDRPGVIRAFAAASVTVAVVSLLVVYAIWREPDGETFYRVLAALAVLDVFLVVLQPILRRLGGDEDGTTVVLEGTREQIADALSRVEGTGVRIRR
jgi:hypothetical protein